MSRHNEGPALNTDREIWRERPGDYYADSIHVTASGSIGIDCGGMVYTLPVREWHRLAATTSAGVTEEQTPRVRPLEWVGPHMHLWVAEPMPGLQFRILHDERGHDAFSWFFAGNWAPEPSLEAAKAAAQHEYETLILAALEASRSPVSQKEAEPVALTYTNYKGETAERTITPMDVWFGSTEWHPEPQYLVRAFDHDKQAERDFALKDFGHPAPAPAGEPAVKALEWEGGDNPSIAISAVGVYHIWPNLALETPAPRKVRRYESIEAAKAAAQADYEARIRSALHPSPTPVSAPAGESSND